MVVDGTVDGRNTANHLGCEISLQNKWDNFAHINWLPGFLNHQQSEVRLVTFFLIHGQWFGISILIR